MTVKTPKMSTFMNESPSVVRELERDQECEVEPDSEIDHGLSTTHDAVHQEETKDAE